MIFVIFVIIISKIFSVLGVKIINLSTGTIYYENLGTNGPSFLLV